jgi:nicotinate phosphoribosyltransferase
VDKPIITSLLDTDFYKYSMGQVVYNNFPDAMVEYEFKCRDPHLSFAPIMNELHRQVEAFCGLSHSDEELQYLNSLGYFKPAYLEFLKNYRPPYKAVELGCSSSGELSIRIKGSWLQTIFFEVPLLAIVNELYFKHTTKNPDYIGAVSLLMDKIGSANNVGLPFVDFGTRRRFSQDWQCTALDKILSYSKTFGGTSNIYFAKHFKQRVIGTMAHEFICAMQGLVPIRDSQSFALELWLKEYRGRLGIVLSDTLGMNAFLRDFDYLLASAYSGARQDSGNPFDWCDKLIAHYRKLDINPETKTAVFSDGLTFPKAIEIYERYKGKINMLFGIGTNLMNSFPDVKPLQIVIKLTKVQGLPVIKLSDSEGKSMCKDAEYMAWVKKVFQIN